MIHNTVPPVGLHLWTYVGSGARLEEAGLLQLPDEAVVRLLRGLLLAELRPLQEQGVHLLAQARRVARVLPA